MPPGLGLETGVELSGQAGSIREKTGVQRV